MRNFVHGVIKSLIYFCFCFLEMLKSQLQKLTKVLPKPIASLTLLTEAKTEFIKSPLIYGLIQFGAKEERRERRKQTNRVVALS